MILGVSPPEFWWGARRFHRPLPDFSLNLFVQAKRPTPGSRAPKKLGALGLKGPFWKFGIDQQQQAVLAALFKSTSGSALVCYAAPAFHRVTELWAHSRTGTIVEASTFPPVDKLNGHSIWYYEGPGAAGFANPTPERVQGASLPGRILEFASGTNARATDFGTGLKKLSEAVAASVYETPDSGRSAVYFEAIREIDDYLDYLRPMRHPEAMAAYLRVAAFAAVFQVQWYVLARDEGVQAPR